MAITDSTGTSKGDGAAAPRKVSSDGGGLPAGVKVLLWLAIVIGFGVLRYWLRHH